MSTPRPQRPGKPADPVTIDVDVTEIDGVTHEADAARTGERGGPRPARPGGAAPGQGWRNEWTGRVRTLDSRWWPLWVVLGIIALALALTVGVVFAAVYLIFRIIVVSIRWVFAFLFPGSSGGGIVRR